MFGWASYWSENSIPGIRDQYDIVDPYTKLVYPYIKSVDIELGIVEEVLYDGFMLNGRPRPRIKHGRVVTRTKMIPFDVVHKKSGETLYRVRR